MIKFLIMKMKHRYTYHLQQRIRENSNMRKQHITSNTTAQRMRYWIKLSNTGGINTEYWTKGSIRTSLHTHIQEIEPDKSSC